MPISRDADIKGFERAPGVTLKAMTDGDRMMLMDVHLEAGSVVEMHTHPHEQTGRLIKGKLKFEIGDETFELGPGDAWIIPGDVPHEATAIDECSIIEVFSPPREDYRGK
jgi:quercetin dioxygenase-like cupin family protein